jgi:hypothetical protein
VVHDLGRAGVVGDDGTGTSPAKSPGHVHGDLDVVYLEVQVQAVAAVPVLGGGLGRQPQRPRRLDVRRPRARSTGCPPSSCA